METGYIICVDDQTAILDSLMMQLENIVGEQYEIETAESANEALELIDDLVESGEQIVMVISDEVMPGMKGSQLLEIVHKRFPQAIKIMLTGQAGLESVAYAINQAGLDKYFTKPWEYDDLKLSILRLLDRARLARRNEQLTTALQEKYQELENAYTQLEAAYQRLQETQDHLVHTEKLAVVGQLASSIAHEVKNQLNTIGFVELIGAAYPDDEKVQKYVGYIVNAGNNIYNLIDEMRRFAKKEPGQYDLEVCSMTDVITKLLNFIRFDKALASRNIVTAFNAEPTVRVNCEKIGQVLINLIRNAAQATPEQTGEITIEVTSRGEHALVHVRDNGCGIAEEQLPKIWEPFFTTKGDEGTGLGLDICKRIIEEHHGRITCDSQVNVGTTFAIALPIVRDE
jgi:signal transduction histidine kinase